MDDEKDLLESIQKNLELRSDLEAQKGRVSENYSKTKSSKSKSSKTEYAKDSQKKPPEVEVIIEEFRDPEDAPPLGERKVARPKAARQEDEKPAKKKRRKKKKRKRHLLLKLFIIIVVLIFGLHSLLTWFVSGTNYEPYETDYVRADDVMTSVWVENILIVGTDARNSDSSSRSDCIIILSINKRSGTLVMTSILRDSYVTIPGYGENRINAAYQYGGAALLIQTIEENFKIGIDHYVTVDFFSFIDIIDALGGVEIDVDADEAYYVNLYLCEINELLGAEQGDGNLTETGLQTLSGKQALSYSRIRYIGTDFARTGRQREVINAMIAKAKTLNPLQLLYLCNDVFPELTTDLTDSELAWLLMQAPFLLAFESVECQIPADNTWSNLTTSSGMQVLEIDFEANIEILQQTIYGSN